jgi:D-sedoheptulose 7-phosphate isomerase
MADPNEKLVVTHFRSSCDVLQRAAEDNVLRAAILTVAEVATLSLRNGNKILLAGNGGSAADAQHIAAELVTRFHFDRSPLAAIALSTDTSVLTATGNDYGYDQIFERQIRALGRPGDVFIAISTSGRSPNIIAALNAARDAGVITVGFTGSKEGPMRALCDHCLVAPSEQTAMIQQVHIVMAHAICAIIENNVLAESGTSEKC